VECAWLDTALKQRGLTRRAGSAYNVFAVRRLDSKLPVWSWLHARRAALLKARSRRVSRWAEFVGCLGGLAKLPFRPDATLSEPAHSKLGASFEKIVKLGSRTYIYVADGQQFDSDTGYDASGTVPRGG
jgi:hypothetical protein